MEWVETTGKTIDEAKDAALDELGVDEQEAEFEILEEPRTGLFGRPRGEARVRARVLPKQPRPKADRRERRRRGPRNGGNGSDTGKKASKSAKQGGERPKPDPDSSTTDARSTDESATTQTSGGRQRPPATGGSESDKPARPSGAKKAAEQAEQGEPMSSETVSMDEQADIIEDFLDGLVEAFGFEASLDRASIDEEMLEVQVNADDLGLLIGPKGATLSAVQELARMVLQRKATGTYEGRVRIDIGGYRGRRKVALERFATDIAEQVRSSGTAKVLEPMHPADRKIVHDTVNGIDGVTTSSEGDEPYRRVVISPAD